MMRTALQKCLTNAGIYATIIVIFTYNLISERNVGCICTKEEQHYWKCWLFLFLPFATFFVLILWVDRICQRSCMYARRECSKCHFCCIAVHQLVRAAAVSLLWIVCVLYDGDWFVCCWVDQSGQELACKDKNNLTADEERTTAELKDKSRVS